MNKLLLTTALITACATSQVNAQIQNMNPLPGDVFNYEYFDLTVADSGSIGNNQTWDFSDAATLDENWIKTYRALTAQEQTDFPAANLAYTEDSDPTVYLMNASADSLTDLGDTEVMFTNPIVLYKYPINTTYNFSDVTSITGNPMFSFTGTMRTFYQGNGTLITPFGTYENVMKIRRKGTINMVVGGMAEQVLVDGFVWINADNKTELLSIEASDYENEEDEVDAFFLKNGAFAGVDEVQKDIFSLYPNPSNDVVYLQSAAEMPVSFQVYSVSGVLVQSGKYISSQGISAGNLEAGEYIIKAVTSNGISSHVKFTKI